MPGDVAGACQDARLLFVQTGKNCSLHLQSPTRSSTENILSLISIHAASVSSRLGSRTESRAQPSVHRCGDQDTSNNNSAVALLRPPNVTIHCRDVGPDLGGQTGDGEIGLRSAWGTERTRFLHHLCRHQN
jgi:hypothetical protein